MCSLTPHQSLYVEILICNVILLGGVAFWGRLSNEGGAFMNRISAIMKKSPESPLPFHHMRIQAENSL